MRVVIQRVKRASVSINQKMVSKISQGILILLGIEEADSETDIVWLVKKIVNLRIFNDSQEKMNLSVKDIDGDLLLVSQFTLHASTKKGNRPGFTKAARPEKANALYLDFKNELEIEMGKKIGAGKFGAMMDVELINDGPVTILIDSKSKE